MEAFHEQLPMEVVHHDEVVHDVKAQDDEDHDEPLVEVVHRLAQDDVQEHDVQNDMDDADLCLACLLLD